MRGGWRGLPPSAVVPPPLIKVVKVSLPAFFLSSHFAKSGSGVGAGQARVTKMVRCALGGKATCG